MCNINSDFDRKQMGFVGIDISTCHHLSIYFCIEQTSLSDQNWKVTVGKMRAFQTVVSLFDNTIMDPDTCKLIRRLCIEFQLTPDIEFTCYEGYMTYFSRYTDDLEKRSKDTILNYNGTMMSTNECIENLLNEIEQTSLLHILALISICAKYINGYRCEKLFNHLSKYLQFNGTPYTTREIRRTEFAVFKFLEFNIKPSGIYTHAFEMINSISNQNCGLIQFDRLHDACVTLLRFIYLYRQRFDEILQYVEQNAYGFDGFEEFKLAAATVYVSAMLTYPHCGNSILAEIVHRSHLNESLLRKFGQAIYDFYFEHMK